MIVEKFKYIIWISIIILVLGLVFGIANGGLNLGIDFTGGTLTTVDMGGEFNSADVEKALDNCGVTGYQVVKSGDNYTEAVIRMQVTDDTDIQANLTEDIMAEINKVYPDAVLGAEDKVGGVASTELIINAFLSVIVACALMLIYIWIRFELASGIAAVIALVHDVGIMIAVMAILQLQVNSSFIAACLTIVGYSINNTIVIFDRVRDNNKVMGIKKYTRAEIGNKSVKDTLRRTINTSVTTLIMIVALYVLGVTSIKEFAFPIIIGIVAGTFSSIFVSVPIAVWFQNKLKPAKSKK